MNIVEARLNRFSEICADIGQVALASIVIPFLLDRPDPIKVTLGLVISLTAWALSILLVRKNS